MELHGVGVGRGVVVGTVRRMPDPLPEPADVPFLGDPVLEFAAVVAAQRHVAQELLGRGARAGAQAQAILDAVAMMAEDPSLIAQVRQRIEAGATGERAVFEAFAGFQTTLEGLGGRFAERAVDLADVAGRVIAQLRGVGAPGVPVSEHPFILVAPDLAPADAALLDPALVLGLITRDGGPTSHTAVLARAKSLPTIVAVAEALEIQEGTEVLLDAAAGVVRTDPSTAERAAAGTPPPAAHSDTAGRTGARAGSLADGTAVPLLGILGSAADAADALDRGAEGIGLFRTEFLYLDAASAPSIADQQARYLQLLRHFPGKTVIVRCFDSGADKPLKFLPVPRGENPALGMRGLRALRAHEPVLRDQLTALARAGAQADADLWVMAPIVTDPEQAAYFVRLGHDSGLSTVGVMAEVPSLAILADQVAEVADFISVGTNDLTQYTLAADRQLGAMSGLQDPWHPAVLRLIQRIGAAGAAAGKHISVCGEAAADPQLAVVLVGLGATTLSMAPNALGAVRDQLAQVTLEKARELAATALQARSAAEARGSIRHFFAPGSTAPEQNPA
ncbi:phosphoenolpyruvate--protein phosphotransferase [Parafrigoribacterium mesophilum]|uniref:phosphoenolpyruvate--protein phosphotransferase n=1 Tax=Parafrigoribacterium mesophilum TaxID=433646 RepID=UPI0031FE2081